MRKSSLSILFLLATFVGLSQTNLQVTDLVFSNNLEVSSNINFPNFFTENPEGFEQLKSSLITILKEKYDVNESSFYGQGISFINNVDGSGKAFKENHKTLTKKGGFDYYFLASSAISPDDQVDRYTFKTEVKLSNEKGKKVFNSSVEIPFSASFRNDEVASRDLISSEDFYTIYSMAISKALDDSKGKPELQSYYRPKDSQFDEFIENSKRYSLNDFLSLNPVLTGGDSDVPIKIMSSNVSEIDITKANEGMLMRGQRIDKPIVTSFRNPMSSNYWVTLVQGKENSGFEDLNLAPSADIFLSFNSQPGVSETPPLYFRLINGKFTGKMDSKTYLISYEPGASLLRIFVDQELTLLSQPLETGNGKDLKVYYSGSPEDFAKNINLHEVYHHSINSIKAKLGEN